MPVTLAQFAAALITVFEGERLTAYKDTGGVWTNGIGNTHNVAPGSTITHEQAVADFERNQAGLISLVDGKPICEAAALVSFGFNCGRWAMEEALKDLGEMARPVHTTDRHGHVLPGLVARRRLEILLTEVVP